MDFNLDRGCRYVRVEKVHVCTYRLLTPTCKVKGMVYFEKTICMLANRHGLVYLWIMRIGRFTAPIVCGGWLCTIGKFHWEIPWFIPMWRPTFQRTFCHQKQENRTYFCERTGISLQGIVVHRQRWRGVCCSHFTIFRTSQCNNTISRNFHSVGGVNTHNSIKCQCMRPQIRGAY